MASRTQALLVIFYILIFASFQSTHGSKIAIYWGQNRNEGTLQEACNTGNYEILILAFLSTFGNGHTPKLNLAGHCDPDSGGCTGLSSEIAACKSKGILVLLSIGGGTRKTYSLSSTEDAKQLADYLWNNFLGGQSGSRPLGDAVLDGIDFAIQTDNDAYWDDLAKALKNHGNVVLSAAPQCIYADRSLDKAISTGLFDYVWVQFYNNPPCEYRGGSAENLIFAWNQYWALDPAIKQLFLGLPASPEAARSGFIEVHELKDQVIPFINNSTKYRGVMLWSRMYDKGYSSSIKPFILKTVSKMTFLSSYDA